MANCEGDAVVGAGGGKNEHAQVVEHVELEIPPFVAGGVIKICVGLVHFTQESRNILVPEKSSIVGQNIRIKFLIFLAQLSFSFFFLVAMIQKIKNLLLFEWFHGAKRDSRELNRISFDDTL